MYLPYFSIDWFNTFSFFVIANLINDYQTWQTQISLIRGFNNINNKFIHLIGPIIVQCWQLYQRISSKQLNAPKNLLLFSFISISMGYFLYFEFAMVDFKFFFINFSKVPQLNRQRNGYKSINNIKVVFIDSFKHPEVTKKVDYITTILHVYCKHSFRLHTRVSFICIFR